MRKFTKIKTEGAPQNVIRLPRIGKIRLGVKKMTSSGKEYPTEVDYFVVPPEVQERYGEKPKVLPVMIPVEDESMFLRQYYACYGGSQKLKCQGDGELCARRNDKGDIEELPCPSPDSCDFGKKNKCSARTDIMVVLPDINCGATYQISTGSINSDIDLRSGLEMAKYLFGRVSWVPMEIRREEMKIPDPATGKMQTHWPVKLYPTATVAQANVLRQDTKRIFDRQQAFVLDEPIIEGTAPDTPTEIITDAEAAALALPTEATTAKTPDEVTHPSEAKKEEPNEATKSGSKTNNYEYLKVMAKEKSRVGEKTYYDLLKAFGVKHADQIVDRKKQEQAYKTLSGMPPADCTLDPNTCAHSQFDDTLKASCGTRKCTYSKK